MILTRPQKEARTMMAIGLAEGGVIPAELAILLISSLWDEITELSQEYARDLPDEIYQKYDFIKMVANATLNDEGRAVLLKEAVEGTVEAYYVEED